MKTIELTDKAYADLLKFKNFFTIKLHGITNKEMLDFINNQKDGVTSGMDILFPTRKVDYDPDYTFSELLSEWIESTYQEQQTGRVNFIT